jgi:uncharacterized protein
MRFLDPLYGEIELTDTLARLVNCPAIQRLRRVRLSNIDSIDTPAIAGVSRFEHVLGTCHLAHHVGFFRQLLDEERLTLTAACLVHDIAITPFGHLLEEALRYSGVDYNHEEKLTALFHGGEETEVGGLELQIYEGAEAGIGKWAKETFGLSHLDRLREMLLAVLGKGRWGPCVAGSLDLDNLDNVTRLAVHMGLQVERELPRKLAAGIVAADAEGKVWGVESAPLLIDWIQLRYTLYSRLMLAPRDFVAKTMLTVAIIRGLRNGQLGSTGYEWTLTDDELVRRLSRESADGIDQSEARWIAETITRWHLGDLWSCTPLMWISGPMPPRTTVREFGETCTHYLARDCFAHGIPDKRHRRVAVRFEDGTTQHFGRLSEKWLLGVMSPLRAPFKRTDVQTVSHLARETFRSDIWHVDSNAVESDQSLVLFDVG